MPDLGCARNLFSLLRNLLLAILLYSSIYILINLVRTGSIDPRVRLKHTQSAQVPAKEEIRPIGGPSSSSSSKVTIQIGNAKTITINPHANWFNRPESAVLPRDDYLGPRPHVDTVANLSLLVEECRGTYEGLESMRDVFHCMEYQANKEDEYYFVPETGSRASEQDPQKAEYLNADGHNNTLQKYLSVSAAEPAALSSVGTCPGPIIPMHVYWTGPATWRVEIFIKSYLYTQNLPCSRLWLWLDTDRNPKALDHMLRKDVLFKRFLPFVERGDVVLKEWKFPSRIPLPKDMDNTDGVGYYQTPGKPDFNGDSAVADGIVRDETGQEWLALTSKQMTFLPQAISDAVRFVILHLHGGLYCDMDVLFLRDMRPLLLPDPSTGEHAFAERWAAHPHPGDYNTAIMSLTANSSLSSYFLRGGVRMGLNFHPRVIGRMAWKDKRNQELLMLETAAFDPIWTEFNWAREGRCTVPCLRDYGVAFKGKPEAIRDEWESYDGPQLEEIDLTKREMDADALEHTLPDATPTRRQRRAELAKRYESAEEQPPAPGDKSVVESFSTTSEEEDTLRAAGVIGDYRITEDTYPPNNRTLENFFRGAWTYHIHNQVRTHPQS